MVRNVLDRKTFFSPIFRMDDKKAFNEDFDEVKKISPITFVIHDCMGHGHIRGSSIHGKIN